MPLAPPTERSLQQTDTVKPKVKKPVPTKKVVMDSAVQKETEEPLIKKVLPADTTPPYVYASPGPGLYDVPIEVRLFSDEPSEIEYYLDNDKKWRVYRNPIPVTDFTVITFRGRDSARNLSDEVMRGFFIEKRKDGKCPKEMVLIESASGFFCMDRYEWPNRRGERPEGFINWYMAYDSCRMYKKRLCTAVEWEKACTGREGNTYPYGNEYEVRTCNTEGNHSLPSGKFIECRSFYGTHDMSGNLREWTSTRNTKNPRHFQVYGGFWESRGASKCRSTQYSFFPENKFIAVGFRCCKSVIKP